MAKFKVKPGRKTVIFILIAALCVVAAAFFYKANSDVYYHNGTPLKKVEGYHYVEYGQATCMALTPACGYCPGEVINKECWIESK